VVEKGANANFYSSGAFASGATVTLVGDGGSQSNTYGSSGGSPGAAAKLQEIYEYCKDISEKQKDISEKQEHDSHLLGEVHNATTTKKRPPASAKRPVAGADMSPVNLGDTHFGNSPR